MNWKFWERELMLENTKEMRRDKAVKNGKNTGRRRGRISKTTELLQKTKL